MRATISLMLLAIASSAFADGSSMVKHQVNAGKLDDAGFTIVESVSGGMKFEMPCIFDETSVKTGAEARPNSPHPATAGTFVVCANQKKFKHSAIVVRTAYRDGVADADKYFDMQLKDYESKGNVENIDYKGDRAFKANYYRNGVCEWRLAVRHESDLITLTLSRLAADCDSTKAMADRFLSSLEFRL